MEFGLVLTQMSGRWAHTEGDALLAEEVGLDSIWLVDHLAGAWVPTGNIYEAWTTLAALAVTTSRVRLGHLVTCVSFRNVGLLAKMAATVDHVSGGRLELGLGAGWFEDEYRAFGYPFPSPGERRRAFEEALDALTLLFAGGPVDFDGEYVRLERATCHPVPIQRPRPPITVGTGGRLMRRLTGEKADTWNCPTSLLPDLDAARAVVMKAAGDRPVRTTIQVPVAVGRDPGEAEAASQVAREHLDLLDSVGIVGTIDQALDRIADYQSRGVDGCIAILPGSRSRPDFIAAYGELAAAFRSM